MEKDDKNSPKQEKQPEQSSVSPSGRSSDKPSSWPIYGPSTWPNRPPRRRPSRPPSIRPSGRASGVFDKEKATVPAENAETSMGQQLIHEFLTAFLGSLVPGVLFTVTTSCVLLPALYMLIDIASNILSDELAERILIGVKITKLLIMTKDIPTMTFIAAAVVLIVFSYVIGQMFFRRSPDEPDRASYRSLAKGRDSTWLRRNLACDNEEGCQFPYPYLGHYLEQRGHGYLKCLIPSSVGHHDAPGAWHGASENNAGENNANKQNASEHDTSKKNSSKRDEDDPLRTRSKTFINSLKILLAYHRPHKVREALRLEAHVRLSTSTWYVAKAVLLSRRRAAT